MALTCCQICILCNTAGKMNPNLVTFAGDSYNELAVTITLPIGRVSLARENEAGGSWGQKVHILHVNV